MAQYHDQDAVAGLVWGWVGNNRKRLYRKWSPLLQSYKVTTREANVCSWQSRSCSRCVQALRQLVQVNPQILQPMLQELGKQNPQLLQQINNNQVKLCGSM